MECLRCGECCKASSCAFGEYDQEKKQCRSLVEVGEDTAGNKLYGCGIYNEIIKCPTSEICPAFGAGCCRTLFNEARNRIRKAEEDKP